MVDRLVLVDSIVVDSMMEHGLVDSVMDGWLLMMDCVVDCWLLMVDSMMDRWLMMMDSMMDCCWLKVDTVMSSVVKNSMVRPG